MTDGQGRDIIQVQLEVMNMKLDRLIDVIEKCFDKPDNSPYQYPMEKPMGEWGYVPKCCENCSNPPKNGGSGICNCTLPYFAENTTGAPTYQTTKTVEITNPFYISTETEEKPV